MAKPSGDWDILNDQGLFFPTDCNVFEVGKKKKFTFK